MKNAPDVIIVEAHASHHWDRSFHARSTPWTCSQGDERAAGRCFYVESYLQIRANRRINASCDKNQGRPVVFDLTSTIIPGYYELSARYSIRYATSSYLAVFDRILRYNTYIDICSWENIYIREYLRYPFHPFHFLFLFQFEEKREKTQHRNIFIFLYHIFFIIYFLYFYIIAKPRKLSNCRVKHSQLRTCPLSISLLF